MRLDPSPLRDIAGRLHRWMREQAWPLWWTQGRHPNGAFFEALDLSGRAVADPESRVRVQARQLFGFMLAEQLGWRPDGFVQGLAVSAARFVDGCFRPDGLAGCRIDIERGVLTNEMPDLYDNAFCLLALAQGRKVLGSGRADALIGRLVRSIDEHLAYPQGRGCRESIPAPARRLQNPHMHLLESLLLLYEHTGSTSVRQRAEALLRFIDETFFDSQNSFVREVFDDAQTAAAENAAKGPSPQRHRDAEADDHYEPGHSMEWVWLLGYRTRLFGVPLHEFALPLYQHCCAFLAGADGTTASSATDHKATAADQKATAAQASRRRLAKTPMRLTAHNSLVDGSCRLWAQAESLKAHLCILELGPPEWGPVALQRVLDCAESLSRDWLTAACPGGWVDQVSAEGRPSAQTMPASTGYHLYLAVSELVRVAKVPSLS